MSSLTAMAAQMLITALRRETHRVGANEPFAREAEGGRDGLSLVWDVRRL